MTRWTAALIAGGAIAAVSAAEAHHSIAGVYDAGRPVTMTGVVREFRFVSPHPWVVIDVADQGGQTRSWRSELDNLFELAGVGITADTLKAGDRVVVTGHPARSGAESLYVRQLDRAADGFRYEQVGNSPRVRFTSR